MIRVALGLVIACALLVAPGASASPPLITAACTPAPTDCHAWHRGDVTLQFSVSGTSLEVRSCHDRHIAADTTGEAHTCTATNTSTGESASLTVVVRRDATPPTVGPAPSRPADANGWYNHALSVSFDGADATSGIASCSPAATYAGPDTTGGALTGMCTDLAGNTSAPATFSFRYDATAPDVTGLSFSRQPDSNGWYTKPVTVTFAGADATAGIESCTSAEYAGPDGAAAVAGACRDRAGNVGQQRMASFKYDATPPTLDSAVAQRERGFVVLRWQASPDTVAVEVERSPGTKGRPATTLYRGKGSSFRDARMPRNKRYRYLVAALDEAGNRTSRTLEVFVPPALFSPAPGARISSPPLLKWEPEPNASYYNVQLFRGRQKILTVWPAKPQLKLRRSWSYLGRTHRLAPGRYTWYVWPGRGARAQAKYGKLIGSSVFVVTR